MAHLSTGLRSPDPRLSPRMGSPPAGSEPRWKGSRNTPLTTYTYTTSCALYNQSITALGTRVYTPAQPPGLDLAVGSVCVCLACTHVVGHSVRIGMYGRRCCRMDVPGKERQKKTTLGRDGGWMDAIPDRSKEFCLGLGWACPRFVCVTRLCVSYFVMGKEVKR